MPRKHKRLWETNLGFPSIIQDLVGWGHGSGEELWEYFASNCQLGDQKATQIMELLGEADEAAHKLGWIK